jgi:GxxExxY protein
MKDFSERDPRTHAIIGAAIEVHKQLGCGFLEPVYQEALAIEFTKRNIPFSREVRLPVHYKGQLLTVGYCADFICFDSVVV